MNIAELFRESMTEAFPNHQITWTGETSCVVGSTPVSIGGVEATVNMSDHQKIELVHAYVSAAKGSVAAIENQ